MLFVVRLLVAAAPPVIATFARCISASGTGLVVGHADGPDDGSDGGSGDGKAVGETDGKADGSEDGTVDGLAVGSSTGLAVGLADGPDDGSDDGSSGGERDGEPDGSGEGSGDGINNITGKGRPRRKQMCSSRFWNCQILHPNILEWRHSDHAGNRILLIRNRRRFGNHLDITQVEKLMVRPLCKNDSRGVALDWVLDWVHFGIM